MKIILVYALTAIALFLTPGLAFAQAPNLGTAAGFVLYTTVGAVTNTGVTHLTGNVGSNSGSSTGFGNVNGIMQSNNGATATCGADLLTAYNDISNTVPTLFPAPLLGNGDTLGAGVYHINGVTTLSGTLNLNAAGDPNAVFIFQVNGPMSTNMSSRINLLNGALACNVFWACEGLVDMSSNTSMKGTIIAHNAAINMNAGDTLEGRALSISGAVSVTGVVGYIPTGCGSAVLTGPAAPVMVASAAYGIFSGNGPVANSGSTFVTGDVGTNVGLTTGFDPLKVTGAIHPIADGYTAASAADLLNVYDYLNVMPYDIELLYPAQFGNDLVLTPHTYVMNGAALFTGNVYLDAKGETDAVFVIQLNGALTTGTFSNVKLINGTQAKNVYWKIEGSVNIGNNSTFNGTMVVNNAAITLNQGDTINGRATTTNGAIATQDIFLAIPQEPCIVAAITGAATVCTSGTTTLSDSTTGGTWSSSNTAIATIGSTGIVSGIAAGTTTVSYTAAAGCAATIIVTVTSLSTSITGTTAICMGSSATLSNATAGGAWSSSDAALAAIGSTGIVTGISGGTATISYAVGSCSKTVVVTVAAAVPEITGNTSVCIGVTATLSNATTGGTWASSNAPVATINAGTGIVSGIAVGTATITYTVIAGCRATTIVTVNTSLTSITGAASVNIGAATAYSNVTAGGVWSSSNTSVASVDAGSGIVTGIVAGTATITYTVSTGCTKTKMITVNAAPSGINGSLNVCIGSTTVLTDATSGGVSWISSDPAIATIGVSSGLVTGVAAGTATITYNVSSGAYATAVVTINALPSAITGAGALCAATTATLASADAGGTWSSTNTAIAAVGPATGLLTANAAGITNITYTLMGCKRITAITVNALPGMITGVTTVCNGSSATLGNSSVGGAWTSSATGIVTVSAGGVIAGVTAGAATISYTLPTGCMRTTTVNVNTIAAVTGNTNACVGVTTMLANATSGGTWSTSSTGIATVNATGVLTGIAAGTATVTYTLTAGCRATTTITVNPAPPAITGTATVCAGSSTLLSNAGSGGAWSNNNGMATVDAAGLVTGVSAGPTVISYTLGTGCYRTMNMTVKVSPVAIAGNRSICIGSNSVVTDATPTGVSWTSSTPSVATIGAGSGLLTGISMGTTLITYLANSGCSVTAIVTVSAALTAGTITGPSSVSVAASIATPVLYTNGVAGGAWTSSNTARATIGASSGLLTGASAGALTITYTVTNSCGTARATQAVTMTSPKAADNAVTENSNSIQLFPNPTTGSFAIQASVAGSLAIYSLEGKLETQYQVNEGTTTLDLPSGIATGMYMCRYNGNDSSTFIVRLMYKQ